MQRLWELVRRTMTVKNCLDTMAMADLCDETELKSKAFELFRSNIRMFEVEDVMALTAAMRLASD